MPEVDPTNAHAAMERVDVDAEAWLDRAEHLQASEDRAFLENRETKDQELQAALQADLASTRDCCEQECSSEAAIQEIASNSPPTLSIAVVEGPMFNPWGDMTAEVQEDEKAKPQLGHDWSRTESARQWSSWREGGEKRDTKWWEDSKSSRHREPASDYTKWNTSKDRWKHGVEDSWGPLWENRQDRQSEDKIDNGHGKLNKSSVWAKQLALCGGTEKQKMNSGEWNNSWQAGAWQAHGDDWQSHSWNQGTDPPSTSSYDGVYVDTWKNRYRLAFKAQTFTVSCSDGTFSDEMGNIAGDSVVIWGMIGKFNPNGIIWENGCLWEREATTSSRLWRQSARGQMQSGPRGPNLPREDVTQAPVRATVVVWRGAFGWLKLAEQIDHPAAAKNAGKIYLHRQDLKWDGKVSLEEGAEVLVNIYVDAIGLGATEFTEII